MKTSLYSLSLFLSSLLLITLTAGCAAQQITPVPVITAPVVTSTAYSQLNLSSPTSALTYTDLPTTGSFCYFVQMLDGAGVSGASNTVCGTTTLSLKHVGLSWIPSSTYTCTNTCTFVVSRATAILSPVGVPTLSTPSNIAQTEVIPMLQLKLVASR